MNFLQLCQWVSQESGLGTSGPSAIANATGMDKKVISWVRQAYLEIQTKRSYWNFLKVDRSFSIGVPGDRSIPFSSKTALSDLKEIEYDSVVIDDGVSKYPVRYVPAQKWLPWARLVKNWTSGNPGRFSVLPGDILTFDQAPNAPLTVELSGWTVAHELVQATDEPIFHKDYHLTIGYWALVHYAAHDEAATVSVDAKDNLFKEMAKLEHRYLPPVEFVQVAM